MLRYLVFVIAYLLGTIPSAFLAGKVQGIDIRQHGSGNIGATNAYRLLGKKAGIAVLVVDALKGGLAAYICFVTFGPWGGVVGGLLAMIGHSWNPYFGFKPSGKGVATGLGVLTILMPKVMLAAIIVFVLTVIGTRYVSLGSMLGALTALIGSFVFEVAIAYKIFALIGATIVLVRHRANMLRILNGTEPKFGQKHKE